MIIKNIERSKQYLKSLIDLAKNSNLKWKNYLIPIVGIILISMLIVISLWMKQPEYGILFNNIGNKESGIIIEELHNMNIPYIINKYNGNIMVPFNKIYETKFALAQKGIPNYGNLGFELLDKSKIGISQFNEHINYQRALEGEISRTIEKISYIKSARVHISLPKTSPFINETKLAKASVILTLYPGISLSFDQIYAIAWLISGTVQDLPLKNINIINNYGQLLFYSGNNDNFFINDINLKYVKEIENNYKKRIISILSPILGINNIHAEVTAQVDFNLVEQTQEYHKPNNNPENMVIRSKQSSIKKSSIAQEFSGGIPGSSSNYPIYERNFEKQNEDSNNKSKLSINYNNPENHQTDKVVNYEVDKTLTHTKFIPGIIRKLSAAVIINNRKNNQEDKYLEFTKEEMQNMLTLVREAIGYSSKRGDTVNIVSMSFFKDNKNIDSNILNNKLSDYFSIKFALFALLLIITVIIITLIYSILFKKNIKKNENFVEKEKIIDNTDINNQKFSIDEELKNLKEISDNNPKLIASILSKWIKEKK